jgi:negative regulator of flagellin synthesis FlgM
MKIENAHSNPIVHKQTENANPVDKNARQAENERLEKLNSKDQASLSESAKLMAMARNRLEEVPDVRNEKIAELSDQVENGTYKVPLEKLASVLISRLFGEE